MLPLLLPLLFAQPAACEFPERHWTVFSSQPLRLEDGTVFAKVLPASSGSHTLPWASGTLDGQGVGHLRLQSSGFVLDVNAPLDVFAATPMAFDDGFKVGDGTPLHVVGMRDGQLLVVPSEREDVVRRGNWTPKALRCDDVRLSPVREPNPKSTGSRIPAGTELRTSARGRVAFETSESVNVEPRTKSGANVEVVAHLDDGAEIRAWVDRAKIDEGTLGEVVGAYIGHHQLRPPPFMCAQSLALFARQSNRVVRVGEIDKGTQLDLVFNQEYADVTPREGTAYTLEPDWHWSVRSEDLYACRAAAH